VAQLVTSFRLQASGAAFSQVRPEPLPPDLRLLAGEEDALLLAGHMSGSEFQSFRDFHNPGLSNADRKDLNRRHDAARDARSGLDPVATENAWLGALEDPRLQAVEGTAAFASSFGKMEFEFGWVVPHLVVPSQAYVKINATQEPEKSADLFQVAFPQPAQPKFEVLDGEGGVYYLVSSSPHMNAGPPIISSAGGLLTVSVGVHLNFILIAYYGETFFARNGTHRLEWATRMHLDRVPALVVRARSADEAGVVLGVDGFSMKKLVTKRPPLIGDFRTSAAMTMPVRRSMYGFTLRTRGLRRA